MAGDCRDRYRNHLQDRAVRHTGAYQLAVRVAAVFNDPHFVGQWSKEEEEELINIVTDMTVNQGKDMDNDIFWGVVSQRMGGKRGRQQCRIKWYLVCILSLGTFLTDHLASQDRLISPSDQKHRRTSALGPYGRVHSRAQVSFRIWRATVGR